MADQPVPTERELDILKILWEQGEGTVRQVHERLSQDLPIVQNTVQAFLRTMEDKKLVRHRVEGRTFIYRPTVKRETTTQRLTSQLLQGVFDGALDQVVQSLLSIRQPSADEIEKLENLLAEAKSTTPRISELKRQKP